VEPVAGSSWAFQLSSASMPLTVTAFDGTGDSLAGGGAATVIAMLAMHAAPPLPQALTTTVWFPGVAETCVATELPLAFAGLALSIAYPIELTVCDEHIEALAAR
jgi:hypothetical protein